VPALTVAIGHAGLLGIFAGLNVVTFFLVFFFVRETAGAGLGGEAGGMTFMSLEELNYIFGVSTRKHIQYQLKSVLPWVLKRYIKRDPDCPRRPPPLYVFAAEYYRQRSSQAGPGKEGEGAEETIPPL
jgi:hypothetical protein